MSNEYPIGRLPVIRRDSHAPADPDEALWRDAPAFDPLPHPLLNSIAAGAGGAWHGGKAKGEFLKLVTMYPASLLRLAMSIIKI